MAHADFRGTPTYFSVFKMMISSKNVNQNMLKIPYCFEKIPKLWRFRLQVPVGLRRLGALPPDPPPPCDLTHTCCTVTNRFKFVDLLKKVLKRKFY